jgi:hypothetical protein
MTDKKKSARRLSQLRIPGRSGEQSAAPRRQSQPMLRIKEGRPATAAESNRERLGLQPLNEERLRQVLDYQAVLRRPDYSVNISDDPKHPLYYDPFSWDRIDNDSYDPFREKDDLKEW